MPSTMHMWKSEDTLWYQSLLPGSHGNGGGHPCAWLVDSFLTAHHYELVYFHPCGSFVNTEPEGGSVGA